MDQNAGANQRQQLRQHLHSHDRCYCRTRGMLTGKSLPDDKPHRACFSGVKIRAVQKFAAVTGEGSAEIARSIKNCGRERSFVFNCEKHSPCRRGFFLYWRREPGKKKKKTGYM